jgi:ankyrin repeat protein
MSRVKLTANNHCHKPVKGGEPVEALIALAAAGQLESYVAGGGDINVCAESGLTALHALARKGSGSKTDRAAFEALMSAGIEVDTLNNRNETPLFRALLTDAQWMWEPLLDAGASVEVVNRKGISLLDIAQKNSGEAWSLAMQKILGRLTLQVSTRRSSPRL